MPTLLKTNISTCVYSRKYETTNIMGDEQVFLNDCENSLKSIRSSK